MTLGPELYEMGEQSAYGGGLVSDWLDLGSTSSTVTGCYVLFMCVRLHPVQYRQYEQHNWRTTGGGGRRECFGQTADLIGSRREQVYILGGPIHQTVGEHRATPGQGDLVSLG